MKDDIMIGSSPAEESCAQVGTENYMELSRKECRALIGQLRRQLGEEPFGARLTIRSNPHDFGDYLTVNCVFDDTVEESVNYAYRCEAECPGSWDEIARKELGI